MLWVLLVALLIVLLVASVPRWSYSRAWAGRPYGYGGVGLVGLLLIILVVLLLLGLI